MQRFKSSLLFAVVAVAMAQTPGAAPQENPASQNNAVLNPTVDTRRVGMRLRCKCGCPDSLASCSMLECGFSKPGKERIAKMQALGMDDKQIIAAFVQDYGAFGWIIPYASVGVGLAAIFLFVKKYRKPKLIPEIGTIEIDDPALEKYKDQIEKDLANME